MILKDLLRRSFRMIGVLREGQTNNDDDTTDAIYVLNDMLSAWSIDPLNIFTRRIDQYTLTPSKQSYTIGPDADDFDTTRPVSIELANLVMTNNAPPLRKKIDIINDEQWGSVKLQGVSSIPTKLYYDGAFPIATIYLWPYPDSAFGLELYTWQQLAAFAAITDEVTLPPGYSEAIASNLAVRLAAEWGKQLRPDVAALAASSKATIESHNAPSPLMECDSAVMGGRNNSSFNRLTGDLG